MVLHWAAQPKDLIPVFALLPFPIDDSRELRGIIGVSFCKSLWLLYHPKKPFQGDFSHPYRRAFSFAGNEINGRSRAYGDPGLYVMPMSVHPQFLLWRAEADNEDIGLALGDPVDNGLVFCRILFEMERGTVTADGLDMGPKRFCIFGGLFRDTRTSSQPEYRWLLHPAGHVEQLCNQIASRDGLHNGFSQDFPRSCRAALSRL